MCGIAALLVTSGVTQVEARLVAMLDAQSHRGPDDSGSVVIPCGDYKVGLGNRRLAIQDL